MDKVDIIACYEAAHNIPDVSRYTEYVEHYQKNMLKMGISPKFIESRYQDALKEREQKQNNEDKRSLVFYTEDDHGLKDIASFSMCNIENMFKEFGRREVKEKRLGLKIENETYYLIQQLDTKEYPEFLDIPDIPDKLALEDMRYQWFLKVIEIRENKMAAEMERIVALSQSSLSAKQDINYTKEIKKRTRQAKTVFINEMMSGFDFREIDLSDAMFIDCNLSGANFSHCNMINCRFINCNMENVILYEAVTNNCTVITGEKKAVVDNIHLK